MLAIYMVVVASKVGTRCAVKAAKVVGVPATRVRRANAFVVNNGCLPRRLGPFGCGSKGCFIGVAFFSFLRLGCHYVLLGDSCVTGGPGFGRRSESLSMELQPLGRNGC